MACPLFASVPDALAENVAVPSAAPRYDQLKTCEDPPAIAALGGVGPETSVAPAPPTVSAGTTDCAVAWPESLTVSETAMSWPLLAVEGLAPIDASSAAGVCSRAGPAFADAVTVAALSLSVPL